MSCSEKITKNIISNCSTQGVGGMEVEAYLLNRTDFDFTFDGTSGNKITDIDRVGAALAYKLKGVNKNFNAGSDRAIVEGFADTYTHSASLKAFENDTLSVKDIDSMGDLVLIIERKQKTTTGDGVFVAYGVQTGLYVTSDTHRQNADNGSRSIELASRATETEQYSKYNVLATNYATTKALLDSLLVPAT
jgi:hypothetical protein